MTLNDAEQKERLKAAEADAAKERERAAARKRKRLSRARKAVAKIEAKTARTKLKQFCPDLYAEIIRYAAWLAELNDWTPEQASEWETELIAEELADIDLWEAGLINPRNNYYL